MNSTMNAMIQTKQGSTDNLQLQQVNRPVPKSDEILVKIHAASVTAGDVFMRKLPRLAYLPMRLMGVKHKRIPGHELAGTVVAVGRQVTKFSVGDDVFGTTTGLRIGTNAEYVSLPEETTTNVLAHKPHNLSYEEAAVIPVGGMTALYLLKKAHVQPSQRVLVYGASGSVGTYAVQLACYFGADVTGICSTKNIEMVKSLGADDVIDYTQQDFLQNGEQYDVIFDTVGKTSKKQIENSLSPNGYYLTTRSMTKESTENLLILKNLIEAGHLRPVIDTCYPLKELADAHRYVESGRKRGNIVITIASNSPTSKSPDRKVTNDVGL